MIELFLVVLLLMGLGFVAKIVLDSKNIRIPLNAKSAFKALLAWIVLGFFSRLANTDALGCLSTNEPVFGMDNILFSAPSLVIILWAFLSKRRALKKLLIGLELTFWVFKLFVFKGGYAVGFGGGPDLTIVLYDLVALTLRFYILIELVEISGKKLLKSLLFATLVLGVKIYMFSVPMNVKFQERRALEEFKITKTELIGDYSGKVILFTDEGPQSEELARIRVHPGRIHLGNIRGLQSDYTFTLESLHHGILSGSGEYLDVTIVKRTSDSLVMSIEDYPNSYLFKLKKHHDL